MMWHEFIPMAIWEAIGFILKCFGLASAIMTLIWFLFREEKEDRGAEHNPPQPKEKFTIRIKKEALKIFQFIKDKFAEYKNK